MESNNKNILEKLSNRNTRQYYDIENKFDDILDNVKKPFDIEYNSFAKRKTFEELMNNKLNDQNLYNKLLLNKIKEEEIVPGDLKYIVDSEINKLKYDIAFQKALEKDYKRYCEMVGDLSDEELNRRYKKYLLQDD